MMAVPLEIPVTIPLDEPTVATARLLLLHTPPGVPSDKVLVAPTHSWAVPVIPPTTGSALTVTMLVTEDDPHEVITE